MLRKVHTRAGHRQNYFHETGGISQNKASSGGNSVIRPPTCHPYSGYKHNKSQSQLRIKYSPTFFLQKNCQQNQVNNNNNVLNTNVTKKFQLFSNQSCIDRLPNNIKHTINQMRVIFKNSVGGSLQKQKYDQFEDMLQILAKRIMNIINESQKVTKKNEQYADRIKLLEESVDKIGKNNKKQTEQLEYQRKYLLKKYGSNVQQQIVLQNCRLGQMNIRYLARISQLQARADPKFEILDQNKDPTNRLDTQLLRCHNRISYLQIKLANTQKNETHLLARVQQLESIVTQLNAKYQNLRDDSIQANNIMNQWRERALMQKEDGQIQISRQQFLLYSLRKLRQNNKGLLDKLLSKSSSSQKLQKKYLSQNPNFEYQTDFFKSLSSKYQKGKGQKLFSNDQIKKNQLGVQVQQNIFDTDYRNYKKGDTFDVNALKLYRPSFYAFLEQSCSSDITNCRSNESTSVSRVFIQVLRAILNSKLNQFLFIDATEKYSRFPEFVYAWFEKFYFNSQKKCVMMLEPFMQKPFSQEMFYKDLMNVRLDQSWEIITFRQFLLEQLSLQELYFFLVCQNLLYTRAGITKQIQYHGDFSILVDYTAAKAVLDITLNDFESWNIIFLTSKLRQKLIIKNSNQMIEVGFFLRCLVEYYRIQRNNRYRYISKLSSEFKDSKNGLRFSSFMSIINKFTELPMETKLKLYRDCFCISKGVITSESIFTICSQNLIFCKYLKMKSFYSLPKIISKSMKYSQSIQTTSNKFKNSDKLCVSPSSPYIQTIIMQFKKTIQQQNSLMHRAESLGVNQLNSQIIYMIRALDDRNTQINSNILKGKHFIHYFFEVMQKIRKITLLNFYELLEQQWKKKNKKFWVQLSEQQMGQIFASEIKHSFEAYERINNLRIWKNKIYNFRVHNAARKIQKSVKLKLIKPYEEIYKYFSQDDKCVQEQKTGNQHGGDALENNARISNHIKN